MRRFLCLPLLLLVVAADEPGARRLSDKSPPAADKEAGSVEVRLLDGSQVMLTIRQENLTVQTRYGKLSVPVRDIRRVEFALRLSPADIGRIEDAVGKLGSDQFIEREKATAELVRIGERAYPALVKASKSGDKETAARAGQVVESLRKQLPAERLRIRKHDVVHTTEFTIVGRIEDESIKARSELFGDVQVRLTQLRELRGVAVGGEIQVVVDAARYAAQTESWLETELEVSAGAELRVTAMGQVDLWPIAGQNGQYVTGPAGTAGWGKGSQPGGALLGRIGPGGKVFVLGAAYTGTAPEDGKLYLRIVPSAWNNASNGSYTVTINSGRR
ncbi:MAG TPA: hypothetical protein VH643_14630 [Gemmataceae bacterium]|jgi:hypothetical protein